MKPFACLLFSLLVLPGLFAQTSISSSLDDQPGTEQQTLSQLLIQADSGTHNADLYYNIGVAYYQTGKPGKAVLYFLRALNINSAHRQARENLAFISSLLPSEHNAPAQPFLVQVFFRIYDFFSLNRLALFVLFLGLLSILCLHWLLHYPPQREKGLPILVLIISIAHFLAFGSALIVKQHRYHHNPRAVVVSEGTEGFASAAGGKAIWELPEGYTVNIQQSGATRSQVILPDGNRGWVASAQIERVVPTKQAK